MEDEKRCGICTSWDTKYADKSDIEPVIKKDGSCCKRGFCRANKGLIYGFLEENTICKQPPDIQPRINNTVSNI